MKKSIIYINITIINLLLTKWQCKDKYLFDNSDIAFLEKKFLSIASSSPEYYHTFVNRAVSLITF